jgi:cytochrome c553
MNGLRFVSLAWLALGPSLAACAAAAPRDGSTAPADRPIAAVHASKCGACHTAPDPKTRTREYL